MTPKIAIVLGQMRSGTSAVAEIVHRLGIPMGRSFVAPAPPVYRFEWEDTELSMVFARFWIRQENPAGGWFPWWKNYLAERKRHARRFNTDRFGMKTPPLALLLDTLLPEARKLGQVALIHVERPQPQIDASVRAAFPPGLVQKALTANASIQQKNAKLPCELLVNYERLVVDPSLHVWAIAKLLEVTDETRIQDAISHVQEPTTPWPQSPQQSSEAGH